MSSFCCATAASTSSASRRVAADAFRRFGRGRHRAQQNVSDCSAHALATATGHTLLFEGEDFSDTDICPALPAAT
jgi:ribonuclease VapC